MLLTYAPCLSDLPYTWPPAIPAPAKIDEGLIKTAMTIDHHRSLYDPATCQTFTEVIVTNKEKPYVLGTRLRVNRDKIAEIEILWTTTGYWLFNADAYLKWSSSENWDTIPAGRRDTRDTLVAAANAYLDAFLEGKKDLVPWGYPCNRTEGGAHTGNGSPMDSCDVGVPSGVNIANRRFIVDETIGAVVVYCTFGAGAPGGSDPRGRGGAGRFGVPASSAMPPSLQDFLAILASPLAGPRSRPASE